jgi:CO/xanthine dehydrogenase Mo-binding subunit
MVNGGGYHNMSESFMGKPSLRREGVGKVIGACKYIDDEVIPDCLHGVTVRSRCARGKIKGIEFTGDIPWSEIVVVSAQDIPGLNAVALILEDQPYLAGNVINHPDEPVLLLAHHDRYLLEKARQHVVIRVEEQPGVFTIEDSLARKAVIWGEDNIMKSIDIVKGDVDSVWSRAHKVVEGSYTTGAQEQLYIEPNGMAAWFEPTAGGDTLVVKGSMQCPYYIHKALKKLFDLPDDRVRVIQSETGGGFGGKEEYPSMIAGHAALLAKKAGKPVKIIYDRAEDMEATTKRHPSRTRHRTAIDAGGKLLAQDIEFCLDGGAYATLSAVVLSRGAIHAAGPYACPNVRIRARAVATNTPPHGAFRGFGAPQSIFALENHLDEVAQAAGLSPAEFRRRNFITKGASTATSQVIREEPDMQAVMQRALTLANYDELHRKFSQQESSARVRRGIGFATFMHGAGFTGSGERMLASIADVQADEHGVVHVLASSTEIGQGTNTIFSQIAADTLQLPIDQIVVDQPDTAFVPNSGPTVASRTVMVVGRLVQDACHDLRKKLQASGLPASYSPAQFKDACARYTKTSGPARGRAQYVQPPEISWDEVKYFGDAYATYAWAAYVAEVTVDLDTYYVTVDNFVAVQEAGHIVNPVLAAGQIEGGVAQGIGYAVYENCVYREGHLANGRMTNYIVPTTVDTPPIIVEFIERDTPYGPGRGAKGIGELPMDGAAPAIANALRQALGTAINDIPAVPEVIHRYVSKHQG